MLIPLFSYGFFWGKERFKIHVFRGGFINVKIEEGAGFCVLIKGRQFNRGGRAPTVL
jgi:hypothetical protein